MLDRRVKEDLDRLFAPRSVALIGATNNLTKWGGMILANIITNDYKGTIYPVHVRDQKVLGIPAYPTISKVPDTVDLACVVTPAPTVHSIMRECGQNGIRTVLVISSDFSETGQEGRRKEEALRDEAQRLDIRREP